MRDSAIKTALMRTVTPGRLGKYLSRSDGDVTSAILLYEENIHLSASFYCPIQCFEVTLRNVIDQAMIEVYGEAWMTDAPLDRGGRDKIEAARKDLAGAGKQPSREGVVAGLSLGFWVGMLGPKYDGTLWRKALYTCFRIDDKTPPRRVVYQRYDEIRWFRNRIAHHEPIFDRDSAAMHARLVEAISWMCHDTARWTAMITREIGPPTLTGPAGS